MHETRSHKSMARLVDDLRDLPTVADVETLGIAVEDAVVSVLLLPGIDRVPPAVLRTLAQNDAGIADVSPQGEPAHLIIEII